MTPTTLRASVAYKLLFSLLVAATPVGTGCVTDVDSGEEDGSDPSALEGDDDDADDTDVGCELGATRECDLPGPTPETPETGFQTCVEGEGGPGWDACQPSSSSTPLVLSFDGRPVEMIATMAGSFDLSGLGATIATDWPAAATPWLALDRDGDGAIGGGEELFGSATVLSGGARAPHGFAALRELDSDGDGRITARDEAWSRLVLWSDRDADRTSSAGEMAPLASRGVTAIELGFERAPRCDARGNCEIERASFTFTDGGAPRAGAIVDVHLRWQ